MRNDSECNVYTPVLLLRDPSVAKNAKNLGQRLRRPVVRMPSEITEILSIVHGLRANPAEFQWISHF